MNVKNIFQSQTATVLAHFIGWVLFLFISWHLVYLIDTQLSTDFIFYSTIVFLLGFFYANYFMLNSGFIQKRYMLIYFAIVLAGLVLYYYIPPIIGRHSPHEFKHMHGPFRQRHGALFGRIRMLLFFIVYVVSTSLGVFRIIIRYRQQQLNAENEKSKAELSLLKSQVNPHFLFNSLQSIYYLTAHKSDKAPDAVLQLSDIMRYTLTDTQADFVPLEKEIVFIEKYIALQQLRLTDKTTISYNTPKNIGDLSIAPMLLIPFIENCFKYGVSTHHESTISIKMSLSATKELRVVLGNRIFNSGKIEGEEFGIRNVKKRLLALYPAKHRLEIHETPETFTVLLFIDLS